MRTFHRLSAGLIAAASVMGIPSLANAQNFANNPYYYSNHTFSSGLYLPQVPMPSGQDEIRAADGTSCRSNAASNGAYLDVGAMGSQDGAGEVNNGTFYGRIIMPLGETPKRLDCTNLYNLEIQRLRHELELIRSGSGAMTMLDADTGRPVAGVTTSARAAKAAWADEGWGKSGRRSDAGANTAPAAAAPAPAPTRAAPTPTAVASERALTLSRVANAEANSTSPDYLGGPSRAIETASVQELAINNGSVMQDIEVLPWSNAPAQAGRTSIIMPKPAPTPVQTRAERIDYSSMIGGNF